MEGDSSLLFYSTLSTLLFFCTFGGRFFSTAKGEQLEKFPAIEDKQISFPSEEVKMEANNTLVWAADGV